ncbi:MAG: NADP-dependent oxidoreductase [Actinomycetaceae bacterium]|nr:NADP-dependent oxidoreductase [Actinomycetaceae bacterium]
MKALALKKYGQPEEWVDMPLPRPEPDQVVVKVAAVGLNPLDRMIADGQFKLLFPYRLPQIMGNEFSGVITEVGNNVTDWKIGDEVYARPNIRHLGAFAEYIAVNAADLAHKPANLSFEEAASLPLVLLTAIQAFTEKSTVGPGVTVFIQGGAGGLGAIAIQVAKYLGATVATTVSAKDIDHVKKLGADIVIDYRRQRYEEHIHNYDIVLDTIGGEETYRAMTVLRPGGQLISVVAAPDAEFARLIGKPIMAPVMAFMSRKQRGAAKKLGVNYSFLFMRANGAQLASFTPVIEEGLIRPFIGEVVPFDELPQALANLKQPKKTSGKVVAAL